MTFVPVLKNLAGSYASALPLAPQLLKEPGWLPYSVWKRGIMKGLEKVVLLLYSSLILPSLPFFVVMRMTP